MPSREYEVQANDVVPEGFWPGAVIETDPDGIEQLMFEAAHVLKMVGGAFTMMAIRQELVDVEGNPTGMFATVGYRGKWESFAPARRAPKPQPQPQPIAEPEPEPEAEAEPDPSQNSTDPDIEEWPEDAERALAETT